MADKEAIDIEDFRFLNFRKFSDNKRKVTPKKHMLNIESKEIYPPEGHLAFLVEASAEGEESSNSSSGSEAEHEQEDQDDNQDQNTDPEADLDKLKRKKLYLIGGASHCEDVTWSFASNLYVYSFVCTQQDLWIEDMKCYDTTKVTGAKIPALAKSAGVLVDDVLLMWGGLNLEPFSPTNELYLIKKKVDQNSKFKAVIYRSNREGIQDSRFDNVLLQGGDVPSPRFGHTLTKLNEENCLMFGGITFPNRDKLSFDCSNTFEHELASADLFNLNITEDENSKLTFSWKKTAIDDTKIKRAFHTATYVPSLAKTVVFGGLVYENGKPTRRLSLQDMVSIKFNQNKKLQGASLVAVRWVGEIRWSSLLSYLAIMYQSIPSLTIPPRQIPREFFERANSPPSRAQRQCEIPTPGTEKLC